MCAPAVQHHVHKQGHKVVIHSLLPRETNIQETYLGWSHFCSTYSYVWIANLVLVIPLCTALPLYFPFRPRDRLDDQSVLLSPPFLPVCKSPMYYILNSPTPTLFLVRTKYKIRLHEVALPLTIEEKKGDVGPSDQEGLRGRK